MVRQGMASIAHLRMMKTFGLAATLLGLSAVAGFAEETQAAAKNVYYSFEGPYGIFDKGQLQRGYKVYAEVCASCHSLKLIAFRDLSKPGGLGFTDEQVKEIAASFMIEDGPGEDGNMFQQPGLPSDHFPPPFPNEEAARAVNGGALPPDLSLITKVRAGWDGTFNQFFKGIGGPEYVYSVLTGFAEPPAELKDELPPGKYYNPYFASGRWIGMPPSLADGQVTFDDGAPDTLDDQARDVSAFLAWTAEMEERKGAASP